MKLTGDLETDIMNQLQEVTGGQTIDELAQHVKRLRSEIMTVLHELQKEKMVALKDGRWILARNSGTSVP